MPNSTGKQPRDEGEIARLSRCRAELAQHLQTLLPEASLQSTRVGDIDLWLLNHDFPRGPLGREAFHKLWQAPPYWAFAWPGGIYLSQLLPPQPSSGWILDLGCGSGILSIALSRAGHQVCAVDNDPLARLATQVNAERNGVEFPVYENLDQLPPLEAVVLADFLYDPANLEQLAPLQRLASRVILADCRLQQVPPGFTALQPASRRVVPDLDWNDEFERVFVAEWRS